MTHGPLSRSHQTRVLAYNKRKFTLIVTMTNNTQHKLRFETLAAMAEFATQFDRGSFVAFRDDPEQIIYMNSDQVTDITTHSFGDR